MKLTLSSKQRYLLGSFIAGCALFGAYHLGQVGQGQSGSELLPEKLDRFAKRAASRQLLGKDGIDPEMSIDGQLAMAIEMVDNGQVDEASDALGKILKVDPNNIKALLEISLIELLDRGRPQEALPYLIKALQVDPDNDHLLGEVADIYVETGQFDEGLGFFSQLREHFPETAAISLRMGQIFYYKSEYRRALKVLEPIINSVTHGGQARSLKARILLQLGRVDPAVEEYHEAEEGLEQNIRVAMISGEPTDFLVKWLETMQIEMAEGLIERQLFKAAEDILYKLSEKIPSDPEVIKLMDLARAGKRDNAG
ncbi:tetratricopeptide repeat protein [Pseudobacteriovorax antillogorgiicola]|uniref:Tetratricopeptide repeat-containing protein n=1 Tax=Pseudobacteriovorax antillogorgiicola TaxID=1513793 RepID=A0A1Y6BVV0_9BACT|nr:tetratricopeptide repeat protein [Pseudobacteriovorax antillogorgiicola]TCS52295.1 tetratricopeptide repeat protein [Pseudobacteriovorax antillogorgiicola]SMF30493.1 Tetratricopeptide repeat-containing protein [Pseudobacteriovorax antillogorgiicola]